MIVNEVPKISDLGSAKRLSADHKNSPYVVSQLYKAPELILGLDYELNIDVWSLGVMIYESVLQKTPFNGKSEGLQLKDIYSKLGSPNDSEIKALETRRSKWDQAEWGCLKGVEADPLFWSPVVKADPTGNLKSVLQECWRYDPDQRISASGLLNHPYFEGVE